MIRDKDLASTGEVSVRLPEASIQRALYYRERVELILRGWATRQHDPAAYPESPTSWFKRNAYRLLKAFVDAKQEHLLIRLANQSPRRLAGLKIIADNPFKVGLFAMCDDDSLSRRQQQVLGNQMLYAYRHGVAPEHLVGFISVAGNAEAIVAKLKAGAREPGFPPL